MLGRFSVNAYKEFGLMECYRILWFETVHVGEMERGRCGPPLLLEKKGARKCRGGRRKEMKERER